MVQMWHGKLEITIRYLSEDVKEADRHVWSSR